MSRLDSLEQVQGELTQVVEAIKRIVYSEDWQKLKRLLLDGIVTSLEHQLVSEASKAEIDTKAIYRLQGQLFWARKYVDLDKLAEVKKLQIENLKNQIKDEKRIPRDGAL